MSISVTLSAPAAPTVAALVPHSRLSDLGIHFPVMVAPMVGLSHVAFRALVQHFIPEGLQALRFTEMLSTKRIPNERLDSTHQLKTVAGEQFFVPQLLGNEERFIAPSIQKLMQLNPWGFDINMGCPVAHVLKHNWGVRLMGDKSYAAQVVQMCKRNSPVPVSVKLRGGAEESLDLDYLQSFTETLEEAGADWLTIHPRPRAQGHKGLANWSLVAQVRAQRNIPVVANGDIQCAADALEVLFHHKIDGAMVARAATARPWITWQIAEDLGYDVAPTAFAGQKAPRGPEQEGHFYGLSCLQLLRYLEQYYADESDANRIQRFSFFVATSSKWLQFGHAFWKLTRGAKCWTQLVDDVNEYLLKSPHIMCERVNFL